MASRLIETRRDRRDLVAEAGIGAVSFTSVLAGVLVSYGAFAVLLAIAAAITAAVGADTDLSTDWEQLGTMGGLIVALILFLSYLFGGYVAGRMARRKGAMHGFLVAALAIGIVAAVAAIARQAADTQGVVDNLRSLGIPTTADEYGNAATVAGIASLLAIVLGSLFGGTLGERWHGRLLTRALDPSIGPEAEARRRAEEEMVEAERKRIRAARERAESEERDGRDEVLHAGVRGGDRDRERAHASDGDIDPTDVVHDGRDRHGETGGDGDRDGDVKPWGWRRQAGFTRAGSKFDKTTGSR